MGNLSGLDVFQEQEGIVVRFIKTSVYLAFNLLPLEEVSAKMFNSIGIDVAQVVSIDGIIDIFTEVIKLIIVNQNICQILDCHLKVNNLIHFFNLFVFF